MSSAEKLIDKMLSEASSDTGFYAAKGVEHFWPEPSDWTIVDLSGKDRFGDASGVTYQNDDEPGAFADFDGSNIVDNGRPGKWSIRFLGTNQKGTFKSEKEVHRILSSISRRLPQLKNKAMSSISSKLPRVSDWIVGSMGEDFGGDDVTYTKESSQDFGLTAIFQNLLDVVGGGSGEVNLSLHDHNPGGGEVSSMGRDWDYSNLRDIPKILAKYEQLVNSKLPGTGF